VTTGPLDAINRLVGGIAALSIAASGLIVAVPGPAVATTTRVKAASTICRSTPFRSDASKHRWFRLPSIVETTAGTLVAFAERRDSLSSGIGDFDVVTARSVNHGCTWSPYRVIGDNAGNRVSNAVPIVDSSTGHVLLFSTVLPVSGGGRGRGVYMQTSTDDGKSFTSLLSHPVKPAGNFKGGLTGPGHGLQLTISHPGRLILPMGYRTTDGLFGAYCIYSDDHGRSWRTGFDHHDPSGTIEFVEGTLAELPDGEVFVSFRNGSTSAKPGDTRYYATSGDGGESLSHSFQKQPLKILSIEGSSLSLRGSSTDLLFSAPSNTTRRNDLAVFVSADQGLTWGQKYQVDLEDTPGAYSDLVQIDGGTIGVLYETGSYTPKERIAYTSIAIPDLTDPTLVASSMSFYRSGHPTLTSSKAKVKITVKVKGVASPPGRVTLAYGRTGQTGTASVVLTKAHQGVRVITLPKLRKGNYRLTLTYSGTARIKKLTKSAGTLHIISR
jgi:sialidase-1